MVYVELNFWNKTEKVSFANRQDAIVFADSLSEMFEGCEFWFQDGSFIVDARHIKLAYD